MLPPVGAREIDELAGGEGGLQPLLRLGVELPAGLGDRGVLAEQVAQGALPRRLPMPSDSLPARGAPEPPRPPSPPPRPPRRARRCRPPGTGFPLRSHATGGAPQQELQIHGEVLELLALGVAHDRPRLAIGLDRNPLLVPTDRLRLLGQRRRGGRRSGSHPRAPMPARGTGRIHGDIFSGNPLDHSRHSLARADADADHSVPRLALLGSVVSERTRRVPESPKGCPRATAPRWG